MPESTNRSPSSTAHSPTLPMMGPPSQVHFGEQFEDADWQLIQAAADVKVSDLCQNVNKKHYAYKTSNEFD